MKLVKERLDYSKKWQLPDVFLFTGNPIMRSNGAIVMGAGAAKQVRDTYPGVDLLMGRAITESGPYTKLVFVQLLPKQVIGWFKVKTHWKNGADLGLVRQSTQELKKIASDYPLNTFHMNFPGIGNGRLNFHDVLEIIEDLPNNVHIYI